MAAGASNPPAPDEPVVGRVSIGGYCLQLGDPSGASLLPIAVKGQSSPPADRDLAPLVEALDGTHSEPEPPPKASARLEGTVTDASQLTSKVERALTLFKEVAQHRLDPSEVSDEVDALVGLLRKLDHEERFEEALRVAHSLAMLLGLMGRWLDLLRSLESALSAAERLADSASKAWALHELGTLNLAAERCADADRMLSQAHDLRRRAGDTHGVELTEHNLQVLCQYLRARLQGESHPSILERLARRPALALLLAALLVVLGGVAGAAIHNTRNVVSNSSAQSGTIITATGGNTTAAGKHKSIPAGKTIAPQTLTGKPTGPKASDPGIESAGSATFQEGEESRFIVTVSGDPTPTVTETGRLPEGVTFSGNTLAGIPTKNGSFPISFTATNSAGSFRQEFLLIVDPAASTTPE